MRGLEGGTWNRAAMHLAGCLPYPNSIRRAFREKVKETAGRGRACLRVWPDVFIATVIKRTAKKRVVEVIRRMTQATLEQAQKLLSQSQGGSVINTAFIERLNGTMRERLASLTRKCRHANWYHSAFQWGMYLIGCTYNLCWNHSTLEQTPAMAAGLTDHAWSLREVLTGHQFPQTWRPR